MSDWHIQPVSDGAFLLDGGTMFGMVPKVLWERVERPDEKNRLALGLTCYLLRRGEQIVLLEAGVGEGFSPKERDIYGLREDVPRLPERLGELGVRPEEVNMVILSHLHFDHAGWCTRRSGKTFVPTFPNAQYVVQRGEFERAVNPHPYTQGSYLSRQLEPVEHAGLWRLLEGDTDLLPGLRTVVTGGHTEFHQIAMIEGEGQKSCFVGDFVPTHHQLRVHYVTAYDQYPLELVSRKQEVLAMAAAEKWRLLFTHDSSMAMAGIRAGDDGHFYVV